MSHPDPHHDPENVRTDDSSFAPVFTQKKHMAKKMTKASHIFPKEFRRFSFHDEMGRQVKKYKNKQK